MNVLKLPLVTQENKILKEWQYLNIWDIVSVQAKIWMRHIESEWIWLKIISREMRKWVPFYIWESQYFCIYFHWCTKWDLVEFTWDNLSWFFNDIWKPTKKG